MTSGGIFILVLLVLFLVWLMLVRPQRRRQLNQQLMIDHLRVGDEVLTAGGFFATVVRIEEDEVTVELSPGSEARLSKRAIAVVMPDEDEAFSIEVGLPPAGIVDPDRSTGQRAHRRATFVLGHELERGTRLLRRIAYVVDVRTDACLLRSGINRHRQPLE